MANVEKLYEELSGYESESDDSYFPLTMRRRRQASDDEDFGEECNVDLHFRAFRTVGEYLDGVSGAHTVSDGDFFTDEESELGKSEKEGVTTVPMKLNVGICKATTEIDGESAKEGVWTVPETLNVGISVVTVEIAGESVTEGVVTMPVKQVFEKKNKLAESYVIPVSGAYYMHDDRLSKNGGRPRSQKHYERNLWKCKDEHKWGHDKFQELTLQEPHSKHTASIEVDKTTKSCNQVYSNNQGRDKYMKEVKTGRTVKGTGPAMYKPIERSNNPHLQSKEHQDGRFMEKKSSTSSARVHNSPTIMHPQSSVQKGLLFSGCQPTPYSDDFDRISSSFRNPYMKQSESASLLGLQPNNFQFTRTEHRGGERRYNLSRNYHDNLFPNAHLRGQHQSDPDKTCGSGSLIGLQRNKFQFARIENRGGITQGGERNSKLSRNYHDNLFPYGRFRGQHQSDPDMTCPANEIPGGSNTSFKPELLNEENDQSRIKLRRYSTMNFNK